MAEQTDTIFIDVQFKTEETASKLAKVTQELAAMKQQQAGLTKDMKNANQVDAEKVKTLAELQKRIAEATAEQKALTGQLQTSISTNKEVGDSFREMDAQLRQLENQYKSLSKADRESAQGQEMKKAIIQQKQALKDFDAELGNHQRNVGNYSGSILDAFSKMGGGASKVIAPIKNVTNGLTAMSSTPIIAIIGVLINLFQKLAEKFKQNGAAMESLTSVFGIFEGVGQIVNKLIDKLAQGVVWLADKFVALADKLGLINDTMKESQRIAQEELELNKLQRENARANADDMKTIADLRAKANEKDKVGTKERLKLLQQAADMEEEISKRNADAAKAAYELQVAKNAQSNSSQEDLKKENDLYIQMVTAQTSYLQKQRELAGQMSAIRKQQEEETRKAAAVRLEIERKLQDALVELDADETSKQIQKIKLAGEREVENLRIKMEQLKQTDTKAREDLGKLIVAREKQTQQQINDVLIKATEQREQALRKNAFDALSLGLKDSILIGQQRLAYMQEQYNAIKNMTTEQRRAIYQTEEQYNAALIAADANLLNARETLQQAYYEREELARQNDYNRKLQKIQTDDVAVAQAEYAQAVAEQQQLLSLDQQTKDLLFANEEQYTAKVIELENRVSAAKQNAMDMERQRAMANATAVAGAMGALSDLINEFGEDNEAAAKASKAIALGKIAVETGVAIAQGVASAMAVPFPANIAAVASTIGTVMANIVTAKKTLESAKFASGGIVGGASFVGDKVPAMLNSGEMVLNKDQQSRLFEIANTPQGGQDYTAMAQALTQAIKELPAPVLVYSEFEQFQKQVTTYKEIGSI